MLQKITASWDCTDVIRQAMSVFGGHGIMEDFSSLPRRFRDSAINELWKVRGMSCSPRCTAISSGSRPGTARRSSYGTF
jgi:hypothetical protein